MPDKKSPENKSISINQKIKIPKGIPTSLDVKTFERAVKTSFKTPPTKKK